MIGLVLLTAGCADRKLENAFEGDYSSAKNNKIINEYCQSCHIHKNLEPRKHMTAVRNLYKRPFFRRATQCRNCHYIEKNWVHNTYGRKTRSPKEANRGGYRDIEKAHGKRKK
ncbi:MAG: hypothetical protein ACE5E9_10215 [Nitrospinaceae bacterium]